MRKRNDLQPARAGSALGELLSFEEYQQASRVWSSIEAFRWYVKKHREELEDAGALVRIGGRPWINPAICDPLVIEIGVREIAALRERKAGVPA